MVENDSFNKMLQYCNSKVRLISRRTLECDIHSLYKTLFHQVFKRLQDHCDKGGKVSITLDAWSSTTQVPFLGLTGHYIEDHTWQFHSLLLGFERLRGSHTADALSRVLLAVLKRFHLSNHVRAITTDNAAVNTKMLTLLEKSLPGFTVADNQVRCMAHIINLAVQVLLSHLKITPQEATNLYAEAGDGPVNLNQIPAVFWRARCIIGKIRASNRLWESFGAQTSAAKLPELRLILDMPVRYIFLSVNI